MSWGYIFSELSKVGSVNRQWYFHFLILHPFTFKIIANIRNNYINKPEFDPSKVARASSAAEGLCKWILAMEQYDRVAKIVAPKKAKLEEAERELAENMAALKETRASLKAVEDKLEELHDNLDRTQVGLVLIALILISYILTFITLH